METFSDLEYNIPTQNHLFRFKYMWTLHNSALRCFLIIYADPRRNVTTILSRHRHVSADYVL